MRALSLWQPWATLMALDAKRFETRPQTCSWFGYRGTVAIHAAKSHEELELCLEEPFCSVLKAGGIRKIGDLAFGAFVAVGEMVAVWSSDSDGTAHAVALRGGVHERAFGNYAPNRVVIEFSSVKPLSAPLPARGYQGLWIVPPDQEAEIVARSLPADRTEKP